MRRVLFVLGVLLVLSACRGDQAEPGPYKGAPIILISVDTLRSDRLPAYGYDKVIFGLVMILNLEIGYLTPPVGLTEPAKVASQCRGLKSPLTPAYRMSAAWSIVTDRSGSRCHVTFASRRTSSCSRSTRCSHSPNAGSGTRWRAEPRAISPPSRAGSTSAPPGRDPSP